MAAEKTTRRRNRGGGVEREAEAAEPTPPADAEADVAAPRVAKPNRSAKGGGAEPPLLRTKDDPRHERRFEPKASPLAILSTVAISISAVLIGAGTFAQWFRAESLGPLKQAPFLLAGGAALLIAVAFFGQQLAKPVRVGDAGVALEKGPTELDRIEWRDVTRLILTRDALTVQSVGSTLSIPLGVHPQASARILAEATVRIPKQIEEKDPDGAASLGEPDDAEGKVIALEPPQVAGVHCKKSDRLIAFEKDARLCGRCGEVYHKDSVPKRCVTCDAKLKS
jgi:hypothetical protein